MKYNFNEVLNLLVRLSANICLVPTGIQIEAHILLVFHFKVTNQAIEQLNSFILLSWQTHLQNNLECQVWISNSVIKYGSGSAGKVGLWPICIWISHLVCKLCLHLWYILLAWFIHRRSEAWAGTAIRLWSLSCLSLEASVERDTCFSWTCHLRSRIPTLRGENQWSE